MEEWNTETDDVKSEWRETWFQKFSDQFNFKIANDHLSAFLSAFGESIDIKFKKFDKSIHQPKSEWTFFYFYDKLNYRATVDLITFPEKGVMTCALNIRLSNDGFLYPPNRLSENLGGWHLLLKDEVLKIFTDVAFVEKVLGTSSWKCMIYYHEDEQRMDLKFRYMNVLVCVQFETGYPETFLDDDVWS